MIDLSTYIVLLHISCLLGASVGVISWFSIVEASIIIDYIWRLWCAILLWSIEDIALHRNIVSLLLALDWCLILLLLLLCMLWLLVAVDPIGLTVSPRKAFAASGRAPRGPVDGDGELERETIVGECDSMRLVTKMKRR